VPSRVSGREDGGEGEPGVVIHAVVGCFASAQHPLPIALLFLTPLFVVLSAVLAPDGNSSLHAIYKLGGVPDATIPDWHGEALHVAST
jgi:hypothetical protein